MVATSAAVLPNIAGLLACTVVEKYKTYREFETRTLFFKMFSFPGEIFQFRQKRKAGVLCLRVPCPVCGDFLPPGALLQPPPADHQHESSWHRVVHRDGSRHHFSLVSTGMLAFCRAFLVCMRVDGLCFSSVHCLYAIP